MKLSRFCSALAIISALGGGAALAASQMPAGDSSGGKAHGMAAKDCRKAFFAAKKDGTLNGLDYKDFKVSKCGIVPSAKAESKNPATRTEPEKAEVTKSESGKSEKKSGVSEHAATEAKAPVVSGSVVFPNKIDPQFASLTPGKARMKTCVAQYNVNKENGGNGSLKWIQKGGGYWSQCNAHLKGDQAQ